MKITIELDGIEDLYKLKRVFCGLPHDKALTELGLDQRTLAVLDADGITEVTQLLGKTDTDLLKIFNMGRKSMLAIREALKANGYGN